MSMQLNTLPASAGSDIGVVSSFGSRFSQLYAAVATGIADWFKLRRQLEEIQGLSDRELVDIGLMQGEINRLRQGEMFCPMGWADEANRRG